MPRDEPCLDSTDPRDELLPPDGRRGTLNLPARPLSDREILGWEFEQQTRQSKHEVDRWVPPWPEDRRRETSLNRFVNGVEHACDHQTLLVDHSVPPSDLLRGVMYP